MHCSIHTPWNTLRRRQEVRMNSIIIPISSQSKFGTGHYCSLFFINDESKAAWLLSPSVISCSSTANISAYFLLTDIGELQKWAFKASKLTNKFSLDIQVVKKALNLSTSWFLKCLVCAINGSRYRCVLLYGILKILRTALFHAVQIFSKLELDKLQIWLP